MDSLDIKDYVAIGISFLSLVISCIALFPAFRAETRKEAFIKSLKKDLMGAKSIIVSLQFNDEEFSENSLMRNINILKDKTHYNLSNDEKEKYLRKEQQKMLFKLQGDIEDNLGDYKISKNKDILQHIVSDIQNMLETLSPLD